MEYTKDIILNINCKKEEGIISLRKWTSKIKSVIKNNRIITLVILLLSVLTLIDIVLVNSFLNLLTKLY